MSKEKLMDRARDELFSHINRCGVLKAAEEDQKHWMDETIEYLGERYPDLGDADLRQLYEIGIRFCKPAIARGAGSNAGAAEEAEVETPAMVESGADVNDMADAGVA
ncbi:MAG TPA: hypothetical protein VLA36_07070 [Longimicrobiales bacterium]|nr:hypothetical protein [Longimicrobiales bacterium]